MLLFFFFSSQEKGKKQDKGDILLFIKFSRNTLTWTELVDLSNTKLSGLGILDSSTRVVATTKPVHGLEPAVLRACSRIEYSVYWFRPEIDNIVIKSILTKEYICLKLMLGLLNLTNIYLKVKNSTCVGVDFNLKMCID